MNTPHGVEENLLEYTQSQSQPRRQESSAAEKQRMAQPENKTRAGRVEVATWKNKRSKDGKEYTYHNYSVRKSWKNKKDEWEDAQISGLSLTDLVHLREAINITIRTEVIRDAKTE